MIYLIQYAVITPPRAPPRQGRLSEGPYSNKHSLSAVFGTAQTTRPLPCLASGVAGVFMERSCYEIRVP